MLRPARLDSIDLLRGLVMILMALDHVRDFFHFVDPQDLAKTTPALFFTRWITHFCAPVFLLLAGVGAYLSTIRGKSTKELSAFLFTRGLWMIFLEWCIVRTFGWAFNFNFDYLPCWVIWTLGWSMIVLAGLVHFPVRVSTLFGLILIFGHHLLDGRKGEDMGSWGWLWHLLHDPRELMVTMGGITAVPGHQRPAGLVLAAGYPLIPWIGVMALGYGLGSIFRWDPRPRRRLLFWAGMGCVGLFLLLRWLNGYGESVPWVRQDTWQMTVVSFLNCTKQPPSLCFLLMTLGPALLFLSYFDLGVGSWARPILTFGRVPMFYYLLHLPLIHGIAVLLAWWQMGEFPVWLFTNPPLADVPQGFGFGLPVVYAIWLCVVLALYPLCRWYADCKRQSQSRWLSYF